MRWSSLLPRRPCRGWGIWIADADRPRRTPPKTVALLEAAMRIGPAVSTICDQTSIAMTGKPVSVAFLACSPWPRNTARL